jgi:hypothetical protein
MADRKSTTEVAKCGIYGKKNSAIPLFSGSFRVSNFMLKFNIYDQQI